MYAVRSSEFERLLTRQRSWKTKGTNVKGFWKLKFRLIGRFSWAVRSDRWTPGATPVADKYRYKCRRSRHDTIPILNRAFVSPLRIYAPHNGLCVKNGFYFIFVFAQLWYWFHVEIFKLHRPKDRQPYSSIAEQTDRQAVSVCAL